MKKPPAIEGEVFAPGEDPKQRVRFPLDGSPDRGDAFAYTFGGRRQGKTAGLLQGAIADAMPEIEKQVRVEFGQREIKVEPIDVPPEMMKRARARMKIAIAKLGLDIEAQIMGKPKPRDVTPKRAPKSRRLK